MILMGKYYSDPKRPAISKKSTQSKTMPKISSTKKTIPRRDFLTIHHFFRPLKSSRNVQKTKTSCSSCKIPECNSLFINPKYRKGSSMIAIINACPRMNALITRCSKYVYPTLRRANLEAPAKKGRETICSKAKCESIKLRMLWASGVLSGP